MEKKIDELIKDYKFYGDERVSCKTVLEHLEQLKAELKEQHKKDVVNTYRHVSLDGNTLSVANHKLLIEKAEQYYNENH